VVALDIKLYLAENYRKKLKFEQILFVKKMRIVFDFELFHLNLYDVEKI
jgi:hypothetical protein